MRIDSVDGVKVVVISKTLLSNAEFCLLRHEQFAQAEQLTWPMVYGQKMHELIELLPLFPSKELFVKQFIKDWKDLLRRKRFRRKPIRGDIGIWGGLMKAGKETCNRIYDRYSVLPPPRAAEIGYRIAFGFPSRSSLRFVFDGRFDAIAYDAESSVWIIREYKSRTWESKLEPVFYVGSFLLLTQQTEFRQKIGMTDEEGLKARDNPGDFIRRIRLEYHLLDAGSTLQYQFDYPAWLRLLLHIEYLQETVLREIRSKMFPINLANCWRCPARKQCDEFFYDVGQPRPYQEALIVDKNIRFLQPAFAAKPYLETRRLDFGGRTLVGTRKRPIPRRLALRIKLSKLSLVVRKTGDLTGGA